MSSSWKKQKYEKQWSQVPGKELKTGYRKGKFTLQLSNAGAGYGMSNAAALHTQRGCGISSFGDAQNLTEDDSLRRELDQVTSRGQSQHKLFIILCCFAGPYLSHNLSYLILEFIVVKCKRKAVLSDYKCF